MKHIQILLSGLLVLTPTFSVLAVSQIATGCDAKRLNIFQEMDYARTHGNSHRISGLEKALSELNANCTDEGLRAKREYDISKKEKKVKERLQELAEAQSDGRTEKINKTTRKLEQAQVELNEARAMLTK